MTTVRVLVALLMATALVLAAALPAAAYTILTSGDQTRNGVTDTWMLDDNGDGRVDRMLIDGNEDGNAEVVMYVDVYGRSTSAWVDTNFDRVFDMAAMPYYSAGAVKQYANSLWFDANQDGAWEHVYYDGNLDGYYEWVQVDSNRDGHADRWLANSAPAGRTATDDMARRVAFNNWVNIMHGLGRPVFFPYTTYPTGG